MPDGLKLFFKILLIAFSAGAALVFLVTALNTANSKATTLNNSVNSAWDESKLTINKTETPAGGK